MSHALFSAVHSVLFTVLSSGTALALSVCPLAEVPTTAAGRSHCSRLASRRAHRQRLNCSDLRANGLLCSSNSDDGLVLLTRLSNCQSLGLIRGCIGLFVIFYVSNTPKASSALQHSAQRYDASELQSSSRVSLVYLIKKKCCSCSRGCMRYQKGINHLFGTFNAT